MFRTDSKSLGSMDASAYDKLRDISGGTQLSPPVMPMFVRFSDVNDSRTGERVDINSLNATFGPNVKLKDIRIDITSEPVSNELLTIIPWLAEIRNGGALRRSKKFDTENRISNLSYYHFKQDGL